MPYPQRGGSPQPFMQPQWPADYSKLPLSRPPLPMGPPEPMGGDSVFAEGGLLSYGDRMSDDSVFGAGGLLEYQDRRQGPQAPLQGESLFSSGGLQQYGNMLAGQQPLVGPPQLPPDNTFGSPSRSFMMRQPGGVPAEPYPQPIVPAAYQNTAGQGLGVTHPSVNRLSQPPGQNHRLTIQNGTNVGLYDYAPTAAGPNMPGGWKGTQVTAGNDGEGQSYRDRGYSVEGMSPNRPALGFGPMSSEVRDTMMLQSLYGMPVTGAMPPESDQSLPAYAMRNRLPIDFATGKLQQSDQHNQALLQQIAQRNDPKFKRDEIARKTLENNPGATNADIVRAIQRQEEISNQIAGQGGQATPGQAESGLARTERILKELGPRLGGELTNVDPATGKARGKIGDVASALWQEDQARTKAGGKKAIDQALLMEELNRIFSQQAIQSYLRPGNFSRGLEQIGERMNTSPIWFGSGLTDEQQGRAALRKLLGQ